MTNWIVILICTAYFLWLWNQLDVRINKTEKLVEGIADDIYDIQKKLGLKPEPRTKNKFDLERFSIIEKAIFNEVTLQQGDTEKAITIVKERFDQEISKHFLESDIKNKAEAAKWIVEENQKEILDLIEQQKSYDEICKAFGGENEFRQGWYNYAAKICRPTLGVNMPIDPTKKIG